MPVVTIKNKTQAKGGSKAATPVAKKTKAKPAPAKEDDEEEDEEDEQPKAKQTKTKKKAAPAKAKKGKPAPVDDDEEDEPATTTKAKKRNTQAKASVIKKVKVKKEFPDEESEDDEDEEEEQPKAKKGKKQAVKKSPKKSKKAKPKSPVKNSTAAAPIASARIRGELDPEFKIVTGIDGVVMTDDDDHLYDAMLCMVEGTSDKYYVLQGIAGDDNKYYCFSRWGRTGAKGQNQLQGPFKTDVEAIEAFEDKFREKTSNEWSNFLAGVFKHVRGKYDCLVSPIAAGVKMARSLGVNWEYEVTDGVNGKATGWYSYDPANADEVEAIYQAWKQNPNSSTNLSQRTISSDTSGWQYQVDLINMFQTNTATKKRRPIRRVNPNNYVLGTVVVGNVQISFTQDDEVEESEDEDEDEDEDE